MMSYFVADSLSPPAAVIEPRGTSAPPQSLATCSLFDADDAALARALIAAEPEAARIAWQRFAPMVHRIITRTVGQCSDIEDLVQDVFMSLFERVSGLRDPGALKAYILSTAIFLTRRELRRRRVRRSTMLSDVVDPDITPGVSSDPEAREALLRFCRILDGLNSEDRAILILRFVHGMTLNDVAETRGVSLSTVKRHLGAAWRRVSLQVSHEPSLSGYLTRASGARGLPKKERRLAAPVDFPAS
jgi:RNA polymerase sigma-70 factor (ECF subfamily)